MPGFSMAASLTSALAGMLVREGRLDVDAPAAVPAWQGTSDPRHAITLDRLLATDGASDISLVVSEAILDAVAAAGT